MPELPANILPQTRIEHSYRRERPGPNACAAAISDSYSAPRYIKRIQIHQVFPPISPQRHRAPCPH